MIPTILTIIFSAWISSKFKIKYGWWAFAAGIILFLLPISYVYLGTTKLCTELTSGQIMGDFSSITLGMFTNTVNICLGKEYNLSLVIAGVITIISFMIGTYFIKYETKKF